MILDYENELTAKGGETILASGYGAKSIDLKAADDIAIGEPLHAMVRVEEAYDAAATATVALVSDDDGAATNETVLASRALSNAQLVADRVYHIGIVYPGLMASTNKFLRLKVTIAGGPPTTGKLVGWVAKGSDQQRANPAGTF